MVPLTIGFAEDIVGGSWSSAMMAPFLFFSPSSSSSFGAALSFVFDGFFPPLPFPSSSPEPAGGAAAPSPTVFCFFCDCFFFFCFVQKKERKMRKT